MIPAWFKRFLTIQRERKLQKSYHKQPQATHPIAYGTIYGYEAVSATSHHVVNKPRIIVTKTYTRTAAYNGRHYYMYDHDQDDVGYSSCDGNYGDGGFSCSGGESDCNGGGDSCGGSGGDDSGGGGSCGGDGGGGSSCGGGGGCGGGD